MSTLHSFIHSFKHSFCNVTQIFRYAVHLMKDTWSSDCKTSNNLVTLSFRIIIAYACFQLNTYVYNYWLCVRCKYASNKVHNPHFVFEISHSSHLLAKMSHWDLWKLWILAFNWLSWARKRFVGARTSTKMHDQQVTKSFFCPRCSSKGIFLEMFLYFARDFCVMDHGDRYTFKGVHCLMCWCCSI